jgi:hypothetical protein
MKLKNLFFYTPLFLLAACGGNENQSKPKDDNKLDAALIFNPNTADSNATISKDVPTMDFVDTSHDFGKIYDGEVVLYSFEFKNNGTSPLLISNASGTCGCTVPDYPRNPIAPGESNKITVKFNSQGKVGIQNKRVDIFTNSAKGTHSLYVNTEVLEAKK